MVQDLKLGSASPNTTDFEAAAQTQGFDKKKKGPGCFLIGCLVAIVLFILPVGGTIFYLFSLSTDDIGQVVVNSLQNPSLSQAIKAAINESQELNAEEKKYILTVYDNFLTNYPSFSPEQQKKFRKIIYAVVKKISQDSQVWTTQELNELMEILDMDTDSADWLNKLYERTQQTEDTATPSTNSTSPYTNPQQYDF